MCGVLSARSVSTSTIDKIHIKKKQTRIVCIGTYSILCDFRAYTSFYAYTRNQSEKVEIAVIIAHLTWHFANTSGHFDFLDLV